MKKKKQAFTLAEVLIALSITGVIAAFIIPQTTTELQKKTAGLRLARTVEQIELGCRNYLEYENDKTNNGSHYITLAQVPDVSIPKLVSFIGLKPDNTEVKTDTFKNYASIPSSILPSAYAAVNPNNNGLLIDGNGTNSGATLPGLIDGNVSLGNGSNGTLVEIRCNNMENPSEIIEGKEACEAHHREYCKKHPDNPSCKGETDLTVDPDSAIPIIPNPEPTPSPTADPKEPSTYKANKSNISIHFLDKINTEITDKNGVITTLIIDVNGIKNKPNMYGKDVFQFDLINSGKLKPYGIDSYKNNCSDTKITDGKACTARVVAEGYKINY